MTLLVGLLALVPLVIGLVLAAQPASTRRVERFGLRHQVPEAERYSPELVSYLTRTRRHRAIGVVCGYVASVAVSLPHDRVSVEFGFLVAGWFCGAVTAELGLAASADAPVGEAPVPGWLLRVPLVQAVVSIVVTVLVLVEAPVRTPWWAVVGWAVGSLACAAAVTVGSRHALRRVPAEPDVTGRATAADAIGGLTGIGALLGVLCLTYAVGAAGEHTFDHVALALGEAAVVWAIGAVVIAAQLVGAAWPGTGDRSAAWRRPHGVLVTVAVLVAVSGGWLGYARWQDHPPYQPAALGATAKLRLTDEAHFDADARALGVTGLTMLLDQPGAQNFVGRLDYRLPDGMKAVGHLKVIVVNRRDSRAAPLLFGTNGGGWDGFLNSLPNRYPWLSAIRPVPEHDPFHDAWLRTQGQAVSAPADTAGPIPFVGSFPATSGLTTADVMVVLVYTGPDSQIYWATPVSIAA